LYFLREGPLRVVTEAYLYQSETMEIAKRWIQHIENLLSDAAVKISGDIELFLELKEQNCAYYFVDHAAHTEFWLKYSDTDELGLPTVTSTSQLKTVLEELYWIHVEHFPMHCQSLPTSKLEEIISIFQHGLCDQMTSRVSTFPYTAQDCTVFVNMLQACRGNMNDGHTTWVIARLWSIIQRHRYLAFYGQEHPRLSRDQAILWDPEPKHYWISTLAAYCTFKTSDMYLARLDDVFVDRVVYADRWAQLVGDCLGQWRPLASGAFVGLVPHLALLVLNTPSPALSIASAALFSLSLGSSVLLVHRYEAMERLSATDAMNYLESIQSPLFKFQFTAFAFSLPKAFLLWGYLVLLANGLLLAGEYLGLRVALGLTGLSLLVILTLYGTTSGWPRTQS